MQSAILAVYISAEQIAYRRDGIYWSMRNLWHLIPHISIISGVYYKRGEGGIGLYAHRTPFPRPNGRKKNVRKPRPCFHLIHIYCRI